MRRPITPPVYTVHSPKTLGRPLQVTNASRHKLIESSIWHVESLSELRSLIRYNDSTILKLIGQRNGFYFSGMLILESFVRVTLLQYSGEWSQTRPYGREYFSRFPCQFHVLNCLFNLASESKKIRKVIQCTANFASLFEDLKEREK